jgi:predicted TIM-barrel fold metal-dependent hydrolase
VIDMSYNGHLVVDTDSHIREYWDLDRTYREYIDPKYGATYEAFSASVRAQQRRPGDVGFGAFYAHPPLRPLGVHDSFGGRARVAPSGARTTTDGVADSAPNRALLANGREVDPACNWDPGSRLRDMDAANIDVGVMFSSQSDIFCMLRDVGFEQALHQAYHRYMSVFCGESDGRLRWLANTVLRDVPAAVAELTYWAERDDNFAGMFVPRLCPDGRLLDNPDLYPLWERSQELDLPIWIHGDPDHPPLTPGYASLDNAAFARGVLKSWGGQAAMGALIGGGVFDLFPRLRVGLFENGAGWMPWFVESLDASYKPGSTSTPNLRRKPSEIVAGGQLFCAIDPPEEELAHCVERLGEEIWLFSTDYPHPPAPWPDGVAMLVERADISERAKVKMLGENARRFLPRLATK